MLQSAYPDIVPGTRADPLKLNFDTQFLEIEDDYDQLRLLQEAVYGGTKRAVYSCLSLVLGIILSFVWGFIMGFLQFVTIWIILPSWKVIQIWWIPGASMTGAILNAIFGKCLKNVASQGTTIQMPDREGRNAPVISNIEQQQAYGVLDPDGQSKLI